MWRVPENNQDIFFLVFGDVECEIMFRALDDADDGVGPT